MNRKQALKDLKQADAALCAVRSDVGNLEAERDRLLADSALAADAEKCARASLVQDTVNARLGDAAAGARLPDLARSVDAKRRDREVFIEAAAELERRVDLRLDEIRAAESVVQAAGRAVAAIISAELREELPKAARGFVEFARKLVALRPLIAALCGDVRPFEGHFGRIFDTELHELDAGIPATPNPLGGDPELQIVIQSAARHAREMADFAARLQERVNQRWTEEQRAKQTLQGAEYLALQ